MQILVTSEEKGDFFQEIRCLFRRGEWAVSRTRKENPKAGFSVTHLPTGLAASAHLDSLKEAKELVSRLHQTVPPAPGKDPSTDEFKSWTLDHVKEKV